MPDPGAQRGGGSSSSRGGGNKGDALSGPSKSGIGPDIADRGFVSSRRDLQTASAKESNTFTSKLKRAKGVLTNQLGPLPTLLGALFPGIGPMMGIGLAMQAMGGVNDPPDDRTASGKDNVIQNASLDALFLDEAEHTELVAPRLGENPQAITGLELSEVFRNASGNIADPEGFAAALESVASNLSFESRQPKESDSDEEEDETTPEAETASLDLETVIGGSALEDLTSAFASLNTAIAKIDPATGANKQI